MPQLPNELILSILQHRRKIIWTSFKQKVHQLLTTCLITATNTQRTNFDFRGYWVTYYQGTNIEICISQRPDWVVMSYVLLVPQQHPKRENEKIKKLIYCPMFHVE